MSTNLMNRDTIQERPGGVWDYISPSRLNLWLKCPLAFRFRYIDGMRTPTSPAAFIGRMVHGSLECFYRHRQLGIVLGQEELASRIVPAWGEAADADGVVFDSVAEEEAAQKQVQDLVIAYLSHVPADEPRPLAVETAAEAPLVDPTTGEDLGIPLVGIMDLVLDETDGPSIVDFKTTARGGEPLEISHEIQLSSYSYLFRHATRRQENCLEIRNLVKTKTPKVEFHRFPVRNEVHSRRLFAVIRAYLDDLDAGRFVFRPGLGCSMCDFREPCRTWQG